MNIENNKIIAEFMGLYYCEKYQFEGWYKNHEGNERVYEFKYDTDWNWLMEVVEKIESLGNDFDINKREQSTNVFVRGVKYSKIISDKSKIQAVYNACVEFIKWYNEQNS